MITVLLVVGILVLLIVTHELGHFIAAKLSRVRVEEFGIGYPPRAFLLGVWGGTEYTINWLPFGGFVRLFGEDVSEAYLPRAGDRSFANASHATQIIILLAGVAANLLVAMLLFVTALHTGIPRVVTSPQPGQTTQLIVSDVIAGSPAGIAGLSVGDKIDAAYVSESGSRPGALTPASVTAFVRSNPGRSIVFEYHHGRTPMKAVMRPAQGVLPGSPSQPALGLALVSVSTAGLPWKESVVESFPLAYSLGSQTFFGLSGVFESTLRGAPNLSDVVGPVGLVGAVGDAAEHGTGSVLVLAGFVALNLVIINLLPIPAFDGGRIVIVLLETITRRRAPKIAVEVLNLLGVALIVMLMITVTYHDIARLIA